MEEVKDAKGVVVLFVDLFDVEGSLRPWASLGSLARTPRLSQTLVSPFFFHVVWGR